MYLTLKHLQCLTSSQSYPCSLLFLIKASELLLLDKSNKSNSSLSQNFLQQNTGNEVLMKIRLYKPKSHQSPLIQSGEQYIIPIIFTHANDGGTTLINQMNHQGLPYLVSFTAPCYSNELPLFGEKGKFIGYSDPLTRAAKATAPDTELKINSLAKVPSPGNQVTFSPTHLQYRLLVQVYGQVRRPLYPSG